MLVTIEREGGLKDNTWHSFKSHRTFGIEPDNLIGCWFF